MSQPTFVDYVYAMQYIRSNLQELIEGDAKKVDQELVGILEQFQAGQENKDEFRQILETNPKARAWWVDLIKTKTPVNDSPTYRGRGDELRGLDSGSSLTGDSPTEPRPILCAVCQFTNNLFSLKSDTFCQNSDFPKHRLAYTTQLI